MLSRRAEGIPSSKFHIRKNLAHVDDEGYRHVMLDAIADHHAYGMRRRKETTKV